MPYSISTSRFSFLQFDELDTISACNWRDTDMCLPVYQPDDVWFQFVIRASAQEEADALCVQDGSPVTVGHVEECSDTLTPFAGTITRARISATEVLYYWPHGITTLDDIDVGNCFRIGVAVFAQSFCSNCFQRIGSDCHTSVLEYYNENSNAFGYFYCSGGGEGETEDGVCEPLILEFTNQSTYSLVWTAYLQSLYGTTPTIQVWLYDGGELVAAGVRVAYNTYPPTQINIDLGGSASGVVKIMK